MSMWPMRGRRGKNRSSAPGGEPVPSRRLSSTEQPSRTSKERPSKRASISSAPSMLRVFLDHDDAENTRQPEISGTLPRAHRAHVRSGIQVQRWMSGSYSRHARLENGPRPTCGRRPTSDLLSRQAGRKWFTRPVAQMNRSVECLSLQSPPHFTECRVLLPSLSHLAAAHRTV